jgi:DNA replication protein
MDPTSNDRDRSIQIPTSFFERHLSRIRDMAALKVLLTIYRHVDQLDREAPFVAEDAIFVDRPLLDGIRLLGSSRDPIDDIRHGIEILVAHDAVVRICVEDSEQDSFWLMPKEPDNLKRLNAYARGSRPFPYQQSGSTEPPRIAVERPNVFRLYEQNIGVLTPLLADQLIEAIELYPDGWIEEAINEAVSLNRRNWRYIQRILQRWATEGRGDETYRRHQGASGFVEPEKYLRGKYSSLFKRGR